MEEFFSVLQVLEKLKSDRPVCEGEHQIATGLHQQVRELEDDLVLARRIGCRITKVFKKLKTFFDLLIGAALGAEPGRQQDHGRVDLDHHLDNLWIRRIGEGEQVLDHVEAGGLDGADAYAPWLDFGQSQLLEFFEGLSNRGPLDLESLGQFALGREPIPGLIPATEDVVAEPVGDAAALGSGGQGLWRILGRLRGA